MSTDLLFFYSEQTGPKNNRGEEKSINKSYTPALPLSYIATATDSISLISPHFIATLFVFKKCLTLVSVLGCWLLMSRVTVLHYNIIYIIWKMENYLCHVSAILMIILDYES